MLVFGKSWKQRGPTMLIAKKTSLGGPLRTPHLDFIGPIELWKSIGNA
jgi:hypothetical protein